MQSQGNIIFVGLKISERLQDQLDSSNTSAKQYFRENNPDYLQVMRIDFDEYIGKIAESGASFEDLSNKFMNVKTMLRMICPNFRFPDEAIKILAAAPERAKNYF
jgi:hypothetical protein